MNADERETEIRRLFPVVRQIARRVVRIVGAGDLDDLVGDGSVGLIRAVDTFDPARGASLEHYARKLIAGAMLNGLRRLDPVSERVRRTLRRVEERRFALAQELGTLPTLVQMEEREPALRRARTAAFRQATLSLDGPLAGEGCALADTRSEPSEEAARAARLRELREAMTLLPERQRRILALHYHDDQSLHTISRRMNVSPQRVSQLHLDALWRLRQALPPP
ncbi:MAG: sigma-70 family RNA polymerase sigma factor [Vulcanimicrobiaceae bacterium]